jgi:hypothetical protein
MGIVEYYYFGNDIIKIYFSEGKRKFRNIKSSFEHEMADEYFEMCITNKTLIELKPWEVAKLLLQDKDCV